MKYLYPAAFFLLLFTVTITAHAQCPVGQYKPDISSPCTNCPPGSYCPGDDNKYLCPSGTYQPNSGSSICFDCPPSSLGGGTGNTDIGQCFTVLPVKLLYFKAEVNNKAIWLTWATATETNNHHFDIERGSNGSNLKTIASLKGSGTTTDITQYHYTDFSPQRGPNLYRLKQADINGRIKISEVRSTNFIVKNEVIIFTVNSGNQLVIQKNNDFPEEINIYNSTGQLLMQNKTNQSQLKLNIEKLSAGLYSVVIKLNKDTFSDKFVK